MVHRGAQIMNDTTYRPGLRLLCAVLACGYGALTACSSADDEQAVSAP